jgi:Ca-activated chloride channel family protein
MMRAGVLLLWLLCFSCVVRAQEPAPPEKPAPKTEQQPEQKEDRSSTIRVDTDLVIFDVKVVNRASGLTATGLKEEDFAVYEDGVKQQISLFSSADAPLSIALVVDTSGSAKEEVSLMRRAARRFLDELRPRDRISVISFNQEVELLTDLTADRKKAERALDQLDAGRGTSFYDALMLTVDEVLKKATGRKAIVVLTDGVDSYGFYTYQQILPALEKAGAALYFLELDTIGYTEERVLLECTDNRYIRLSTKQVKKYTDSFKSYEDLWQFREWCILLPEQKREMNRRLYELAHNELREMATRTGGRVYGVRELKDLDRFYAQVAAELRTQYSLGYYPTNEKHDGKWRKLRVEMRQRDLAPETKPGYRAPLD